VLRVLVVEDSPVARQLLLRILGDAELRVVGEAGNGAEALELAKRLRPDVITMDIHMPLMDGVEATRRIMDEVPTPVVVVTASSDRAATGRAFAALEAGALTVVDKPRGPRSPDFAKQAHTLVDTVKLMAEVKVVSRRPRSAPRARPVPQDAPPRRVAIVAMAASTGGPAALATILRALPPDTSVPILVVQHITPGFEEGLVSWLNESSALPVRLAADGQRLRAGEVAVGPQGVHLGVDGDGTAALGRAAPIGSHRPSATYLFRSVARAYGPRALGVILTGMGNDGAQGLVTLKEAGGWVLAQDEATSVVYGMPREAALLGLADQILPLKDIPGAMAALWGRGHRGPASGPPDGGR
jgi:two-component system chemotaxis response regulator CheB